MGSEFVLFWALIAVSYSGVCGAPSTSRVYGGNNANIGQFPYQISLQRGDSSRTCGGSILNDRFILTAAHCVVVGNGIEPYPAKFFQVRVGSIQRLMGGAVKKIKRIIVNKTFNNFLNDVALLELEEPLKWTDTIQPIELGNEVLLNGTDVIISGWGRISETDALPQRLQWNTLKALSSTECRVYLPKNLFDESLICLSHYRENGSCFGDSGGPATYNGKLVGVAGFVIGGCGSEHPDGYSSVAHHQNWILENISK